MRNQDHRLDPCQCQEFLLVASSKFHLISSRRFRWSLDHSLNRRFLRRFRIFHPKNYSIETVNSNRNRFVPTDSCVLQYGKAFQARSSSFLAAEGNIRATNFGNLLFDFNENNHSHVTISPYPSIWNTLWVYWPRPHSFSKGSFAKISIANWPLPLSLPLALATV